MSCLYDMSELGIPLEQRSIRGTVHAYEGERSILEPANGFPGLSAPVFADAPMGDPVALSTYTIKVCKPCRADWMRAIRDWYVDPPKVERGEVCVRELGAMRRVSLAEWRRLRRKASAKAKQVVA
jgi:hypothetical protein